MAANNTTRRDFLKTAAVAGVGLTILPSGVLSGKNSPSDKLNIALIGAYGRAMAHYDAIKNENVVALCDVDEKNLALAAAKFRGAKRYTDWRKCLDEEKNLDAVVCCTTDHTHAFVAMWAMNRGLHVYLEKPMGITVEEVRLLRETYLKNKGKIAVQQGTQRHEKPNFNRVRDLVRDGAIGDLKAVYAWGNRQLRRDGYPAAEGEPPSRLHYDLWIGPSPFHPYSPEYFAGRPGVNCLQWNMYWDFGTGQVGDMGSHTMDIAWNVIEAGVPTAVEATGEEYNPEVTPVELKASFKHPANSWRGPIDVVWYQGGAMPTADLEGVDLNKIGHGVMFKGTKGFLISSFDNRIIVPFGDAADMTYYKPRPEPTEPMGRFQQEWVNACKTDLKTTCDFEYSGNMMEQLMLGLVAYRAKKPLQYNPKTGRITNDDAANALLKRQYREGWILNG